ncbi:MAG: DUF1697 domain-containing protein [Gemmatimonadota bacterium]
MPRYTAFLKGINVGGHRVKMDRLRELFEQLGLTDVSTIIASGNVIFAAEAHDPVALTAEIERHLARELGYDVPTFLRSPAELSQIVASGAAAADGVADDGTGPEKSVYVVFLREPASRSQRTNFEELNTDMDEFIVAGTEIYWIINGKLSDSPLFDRGLDGALEGASATMRNLNTLRRIAGRLGT